MKYKLLPLLLLLSTGTWAQDHMTPEMLWSLKHVNPEGISQDGKDVYFASKQVNWKTEKSTTAHYALNIANGSKDKIATKDGIEVLEHRKDAWYGMDDKTLYRSTNEGHTWKKIYDGLEDASNVWVSPDGKYVAYSKDVLIKRLLGKDKYADLPNTTGKVYTDLDYRHWDTWEDGKFSHIFIARIGGDDTAVDIMPGEPFDVPQKPYGGPEDLTWRPDSKGLVYVCKKKYGKEYAVSTNTDLYYYNLSNKQTVNWTTGMMGYDTQPTFSPNGKRIAWTSMAHDGYEADKNDIYIMEMGTHNAWKLNLTENWDGIVDNIAWSRAGNKIYFTAAWHGTEQLFEINVPTSLVDNNKAVHPKAHRVTNGMFDINSIVGQAGKDLIVTRCDMNHASEIFAVNTVNGEMRQLTHENDSTYNTIHLSKTVLREVKTADGDRMGVWMIYPPDFDSTKKYPTLLYCQGGPQAALSQFYSLRWNFQLIAAQGYIIVAPNRRGMPGWGVKWNAEISKDWGGMPMKDYLAAIDDAGKEPYVDNNRLGCIGASYGGYSVYMLAGIHNNRFKTFIAHDGLFDLKSWYGTTEELWFANYDIGGPYWDKSNKAAAKSYDKFNPSNYVDKWNTPIMIVQGGIDFRVPVEQGLEAFQAAQLRGIKSKLLYLPNENHWVLHPQNAILWQREFFEWLAETLK